MLLLHSNLVTKSSLIGCFQYVLMIIQKWLTFYWATLYLIWKGLWSCIGLNWQLNW